MKDEAVDITVVIVNWNTRALLLECLGTVYTTILDIPYEVFLVDNGSTDGSVEAVRREYPGVQIISNPSNHGYAAACNQALERMRGRYALLLNTDALLKADAVKILFQFMEATPSAGMACGQLLHPDGRFQNSVALFPSWITLLTNEAFLRVVLPGRLPDKRKTAARPMEVDSCIGACMMVRKDAVKTVGLLDERFFFFFEETDWALRIRWSGWKIYFVPTVRVIHRQGQSAGAGVESRKLFYAARYAFIRKWHPKSYLAMHGLIFLRLMVNTALTGLGVCTTLGLVESLRRRLTIYLKLIAWHFKGCSHVRH